jgi:FlaA1/EpsC-like NDP-sugar epimerase
MFLKTIVLFACLKVGLFSLMGMYKFTWRYVDLGDLSRIYVATVLAESILMVIILIPFAPHFSFLPFPYIQGFPRSIFFIDALLSSLLLSGLRISKRLYLEKIVKINGVRRGIRTLIIGAGGTGEMILRDIAQRGFSDFYPVGILDDDPAKVGCYIRNINVIGTLNQLGQVVEKNKVEALIIAIPSLNHKVLKSIYSQARECGVSTIKIVPRIYDFHRPEINIKNLEEISIEDLIGRQSIIIDQEGIRQLISGKTILITGAGGSIGSEIVMQVCSFDPARLILFDIDETELHATETRINRSFPKVLGKCLFMVGDIRDRARVKEVFFAFKPDIVFHAAAYKHVPLMETNPKEAIKVNVFGTLAVAEMAAKFGCSKFIFISTDKAIRPTSVMGASKRIAEFVCQSFNATADNTEYISVRFGNVLGSRGSVIPTFLNQLKHGGPITVTHPNIQRFFMTIPESVSLVLQASILGKGGEVMVLDMGEPVRIVNLAEDLIRLHGLTPHVDIDIVFTGLRPGEKLFEELLATDEDTIATKHEKVFIVKERESYSIDSIKGMAEEFSAIISETSVQDAEIVRNVLGKYVKYYSQEDEERAGGA